MGTLNTSSTARESGNNWTRFGGHLSSERNTGGWVAYELTAAVGIFLVVEAKLLTFTGYPSRAVFFRWVAGVWYVLLVDSLVYAVLKQEVGGG